MIFRTTFKPIIGIILLVLISLNSYAQKLGVDLIDKDLIKVEQLIVQEKYDEADLILEKVIKSCNSLGLYNKLSIAEYLKGDILKVKHDYHSAYIAYYKSFTIANLLRIMPAKFEAIYRMGDLYYIIANEHSLNTPYLKSIEYFEECELLNYGNRTHKYQILLNERFAVAYYKIESYDKSTFYYLELYKYARQQSLLDKEIFALQGVIDSYKQLAEYNNAIDWELRLVAFYIKIGKRTEATQVYLRIANDYKRNNNAIKAIDYYNLVLNSPHNSSSMEMKALFAIAKIKMNAISPDYILAKSKFSKSLEIAERLDSLTCKLKIFNLLAIMELKQSNLKKAEINISTAIDNLPSEGFNEYRSMIYRTAIEIYKKDNDYESIVKYQGYLIDLQKQQSADRVQRIKEENKAIMKIEALENSAHSSSFSKYLIKTYNLRLEEREIAFAQEKKILASERKQRNVAKEHESQLLEKELENKELENEVHRSNSIALKAKSDAQQDSINALRYEKKLSNEKQRNAVLKDQRTNMIKFSLIAVAGLGLVIVFFFSVKKSNKKLKQKNIIIEHEHQLAEQALVKLKETQSQLLESERLASLGQLTASIAHEIRNPLNFINNFSKLNLELNEELREELEKYIQDPELLKDIMELAEMISGNSDRINEHGERASRIVKQMLDSSRKIGTDFEDADIPLLIEESVKLAYQGVRGKHIDFMAELQFSFDPNITHEKVVAHDLGRVIINLIANSCHATIDKQNKGNDYLPIISISTKDKGDAYEITVEDNGEGMDEDVRVKVFDPFFTTKPTGEGTGLGLTMAFDIITKVHKGSIRVESKKGEFTRFIMIIPKNIES